MALADGIRIAYAPLFQRNENAQKLSKEELTSLVVEFTGAATDSRVPDLTVGTFQRLCKHAKFDGRAISASQPKDDDKEEPEEEAALNPRAHAPTVALAHNIQIHLPDTTDIRVFDAIFRSLREHLLR